MYACTFVCMYICMYVCMMWTTCMYTGEVIAPAMQTIVWKELPVCMCMYALSKHYLFMNVCFFCTCICICMYVWLVLQRWTIIWSWTKGWGIVKIDVCAIVCNMYVVCTRSRRSLLPRWSSFWSRSSSTHTTWCDCCARGECKSTSPS